MDCRLVDNLPEEDHLGAVCTVEQDGDAGGFAARVEFLGANLGMRTPPRCDLLSE
jgi:hypothetical protein